MAAPLVLALAVCLAVSGCTPGPEAAPLVEPVPSDTPTPSPTPTPVPVRPALDELQLTADGLGTLVMGGPVPDTDDPTTTMVAFDPEYCVNEDYGIGPGDEQAGGWKPDPAYDTPGGSAFAISEIDGRLARLDIYTPAIPTDTGLRVGDARADVLAAYPGLAPVSTSPISELYQVHGTTGDLNIEVKLEGKGWENYWGGTKDTILVLRLTPAGSKPVTIAGGDNVIFGCSYSGA